MSIEIHLNNFYVPMLSSEEDTHSEIDKLCSEMSSKINLKYNKYFARYKDINQLILVPLILDPRFKMRSIVHLLGKDGYTKYEVKAKVEELTKLMKDLYDAYQPCPISDASHHSTNNYVGGHLRTSSASSNSGLTLLDDWMDETDYEMVKGHEIDKYLSDPFDKYIPGVDLDILLWWKLNGPLYSILYAIAKDVLTIQVSTVASESCFSTGGRIIDAKRSSLTPRTAEALICFQKWLKGSDIPSFIEDEPSLDLEEFYETCESESFGGNLSTASNTLS